MTGVSTSMQVLQHTEGWGGWGQGVCVSGNATAGPT